MRESGAHGERRRLRAIALSQCHSPERRRLAAVACWAVPLSPSNPEGECSVANGSAGCSVTMVKRQPDSSRAEFRAKVEVRRLASYKGCA